MDNAAGLIAQLNDEVLVSASGGDDVATARHVLADDSSLTMLLMANIAFDSCAESLRNVGTPNARLQEVRATLASACRILRRASRVFSLAARSSDAAALLKASRTSLRAMPLLQRAKLELDALRAASRA
jgi:hypothetical protein